MTVLLVANDGGHITQLHTLRRRLDVGDDVVYVTVRTPQTESMLAGERVEWVPPCPTRDLVALARNTAGFRRLLGRYDVDLVVSTGAALALAALPQARLRGIETVYIESATRVDSPSLSGRVLLRVPGIRTFSQSSGLDGDGWTFLASPWDLYESRPRETTPVIRSVVVSVGTSPFGFRRMITGVLDALPEGVEEVLWQTGTTDVTGLPIDARPSVPGAELREAMSAADVVVTHAGTGSALAAFEAGLTPVLLPRRARHGEHVDDHQLQIAQELGLRGLAVVRDPQHLTTADLLAAAGRSVRLADDIPTLRISDRRR